MSESGTASFWCGALGGVLAGAHTPPNGKNSGKGGMAIPLQVAKTAGRGVWKHPSKWRKRQEGAVWRYPSKWRKLREGAVWRYPSKWRNWWEEGSSDTPPSGEIGGKRGMAIPVQMAKMPGRGVFPSLPYSWICEIGRNVVLMSSRASRRPTAGAPTTAAGPLLKVYCRLLTRPTMRGLSLKAVRTKRKGRSALKS